MEHLSNCFKNAFNFSGRASRAEYWTLYLACLISYFLLGVVAGMTERPSGPNPALYTVTGLFWLVTIVPLFSVAVRRLHDTGRSGWMILCGLIPIIGGLILFIFFLNDSQPGSNTWGPNPYGTEPAVPDDDNQQISVVTPSDQDREQQILAALQNGGIQAVGQIFHSLEQASEAVTRLHREAARLNNTATGDEARASAIERGMDVLEFQQEVQGQVHDINQKIQVIREAFHPLVLGVTKS